ncbi:hypothetical protein ACJX0J_027741, partial [Zea mays]
MHMTLCMLLSYTVNIQVNKKRGENEPDRVIFELASITKTKMPKHILNTILLALQEPEV